MKRKVFLFLAVFCWISLSGKVHIQQNPRTGQGTKDRPPYEFKPHTIGQVWTVESNFGGYGDPNAANTGNPSFDWPGGTHNYYLWEGRLWIGLEYKGVAYVSHADYGNYEWSPSEDYPTGWGPIGPGNSMWDINSAFDDWDPNYNGNPIGIKVFQKALAWSVAPYNNFIVYEYKIVYDKNNSGLPSAPQKLEGVYISWAFDADVCNEDPTECHIDDYVCFDGWTNGEWKDLEHFPSPTDSLTVKADKVDSTPDGVPDQYTIYGDDSYERTLNGDVIYVPRNMSYIYDGDNPKTPENDEGENGACAGYIFGRLIYAPPTPSDSVWTGPNGEQCRIPRVYSHQWWNWNNDPGTDENKLAYMTGTHSMSMGYRFLPHPLDVGAGTFDYRFLLTTGPFDIQDGDTIEIVYVAGIGEGLNGGEDTYWGRGYIPGARQIADYALAAYYMGATESDPEHPSPPSKDHHWIIPVPPAVPDLHYSASEGKVKLVWSDIAETTPDPVDGEYDFAGYRVYRSEWRVGDWKLLAEFDTSYAPNYPHSYIDSTALKGIPYYYVVTAYDKGRPADTLTGMPAIEPLESGKTNYKKDEKGAEIPIYISSAMGSFLDSVRVVPNPYYGSASWEPQYENKIQFMNLPGNCRIRIFTISGDLVKEILHFGPTGDEIWNLRSKNDIEVSSGIYIYKIEHYDENGNFVDSKCGKIIILR